MSATKLNVGDTVPLRLQLDDGDTGMFPQAFIYDDEDNLLSTKNLTHIADGEYGNNTYVMPSEIFIHVRYKVFSDSGHTTPSTHGRALDVFVKNSDTAALIADAVWDESLAGHVAGGSMGANQNLIDDIPTNPLLTNDSRLDNLDAPISDIPTNPLLTDDARLDHLDADISSRESESDAATRASTNQTEHDATQSAIDALESSSAPTVEEIADAVWDEAILGHTGEGSLGGLLSSIPTNPLLTNDSRLDNLDAPISDIPTNPVLADDVRLDYLDASVSSRESEVDASTRSSANISEHDDTQALIEAMEISPAEIADAVWDELAADHVTAGTMGLNENRLDATVSSRESEANAATRATSDANNHNDTQDLIEDLISDSPLPTAEAIADQVWDELLAEHINDGSAGKALKGLADAIQAGTAEINNTSNIFMGKVIE